jgi:hypothetical protein
MRIIAFFLMILIVRTNFAIDAAGPIQLPKYHEMLVISHEHNMWFRGKPIDEQQLIAVVLYLKTTEDLQVLVIFASDDLDKNSEFYKNLTEKLSSRIKIIDWKELKPQLDQ